MLHVASVCTSCCMLLRVVGSCCAKFKTGQTFSYLQTSLRSKRFQSSYCAQVRAGAKKKKVEGGGGGESFPSPSPVIPFFVLVPTFSTNSRGNACYAGYLQTDATVGSCWQRILRPFARDFILSCLFYIKSQRPINQNSNSSNCCQIEWIIKITAHNRRYKWQQIQKEPRIEKTWRTLKRITSVVLLAP